MNVSVAPEGAAGGRALDRLRRLVELESPSSDEPRLRALSAAFASELSALGADTSTVDVPGVGEHVVARLAGDDDRAAPVVVLGHLDTVHPAGSFEPVFRVEGDRAYGPGVFDMKGGWACLLAALTEMRAAGVRPARPVTLLATCDEETGSEHSRAFIEETVQGCRAVLVLEPPLADGSAKTRRKGVGCYRVAVEGRASHAGLAPDRGANAVLELAHQLVAIESFGDPAAGTTATPTLVSGGTASNVVPASASATFDVRFQSPAEGERVDHAFHLLRPGRDGARVTVSGGINRPPMERTHGVAELYDRARSLAAADGWALGEGMSGGASDGSLTAALGIPTLDGLGPRGGGAHASDEHVLVTDLDRRVALYRGLLQTL